MGSSKKGIEGKGPAIGVEGLFEKVFLSQWQPYLWIGGIGFLLYFNALFSVSSASTMINLSSKIIHL